MTIEPYDLTAECQSAPSMAAWFKAVKADCEPCVLSMAVPWYVEVLAEHGEPEKAAALTKLVEDDALSPAQMARHLDQIKEEVAPGLATYLKELDCTVQFNAPKKT
jgi:hypothetical protein